MALTEQQMDTINELMSDIQLSVEDTVYHLTTMSTRRYDPTTPKLSDIATYLQHELQRHGKMWKDEYVSKFRTVVNHLTDLRTF